MANLPSVTNIVGFDLGHGETSVFYSIGAKSDNLQTVFTPESQVTAICGIKNKGEENIIWGEKAINYMESNDPEYFFVGFKTIPGKNANRDNVIEKFSSQIYKDAVYNCPQLLNAKEICWYIGCPSGWSEEAREAYKKIFINAGIQNPTIISESFAALAYIKSYYKQMPLDSISKGVLLLDFGSSTLDATTVKSIDTHGDDGIWLGASLIDRAILEYNLKHAEDASFIPNEKTRKKLKDTKKILLELFNKDKKYNFWALFLARKVKELYFNSGNDFVVLSDYIEDEKIVLCVSRNMMQYILNTPLKNLIDDYENKIDKHIREDIGNQSWIQCCEKYIYKLGKDGDFDSKGYIMLTGGASKMPEVREVIKKCFPYAQYHFDSNPSTCIAKGLVHWGCIDIATRKFDKEFEEEIKKTKVEDGEDVNEFVSFIVDKYYEIDFRMNFCVAVLEIMEKEIDRWRQGIIKSDKIGVNIKEKVKSFFSGSECKEMISLSVEKFENSIRANLNQRFQTLMKKYGFEHELLTKPFIKEDLEEFFMNISKEMGKVIEEAYDEKSFESWGNGLNFWRKFKIDNNSKKEYLVSMGKAILETIDPVIYGKDIVEALLHDILYYLYRDVDKKKNVLKSILTEI